ncbi:Acetoacetyl-coenzyme A synthetase [Porphyridium purpureum]|uniref:Acetoacetyl-coenzyme A synthetase n=1 Tax=Porphyridium purpureum TaxID=35688 RepID=A0A5J4YN64_PORPP|nr:Acetoacetyl-coenzyme A synthetase [Porphyridium purpureum]|eukprot:POR1572..scf244_11
MRSGSCSTRATLMEDKDAIDVLWTPERANVDVSALHVTRFIAFVNERYDARLPAAEFEPLHGWSVAHHVKFWDALWHFLGILHENPYETALRLDRDRTRQGRPALVDVDWFPGATLNVTQNLLRCAVTHPGRIALSFTSENAAIPSSSWTFAELESKVHILASYMKERCSVSTGTRVAAIMPNCGECVVAALATFALGACWSACSPDMGEASVLDRVGQVKPVVLIMVDCVSYKRKVFDCNPLLEKFVTSCDSVRHVIRLNWSSLLMASDGMCTPLTELQKARASSSEEMAFHDFHEILEGGGPSEFAYAHISFEDPMYIMFSSGTTGVPKCLVQGPGVFLNHLKDLMLHVDLQPCHRMLFYTNTGWMMWNWMLSSLAVGSELVLYDGAALVPDNVSVLLRVAAQSKVTHLGVSPAYLAALQSAQVERDQGLRWPELEMLLVTGSRSYKSHFVYAQTLFGSHVPYVSISGGTDINGTFASASKLKPVVSGELQALSLGLDVRVFDSSGTSLVDTEGELVCLTPSPSMPLYLLNDDANCRRYRDTYFGLFGDSCWFHGDTAVLTDRKTLVILGRSDAVLNPGGVRLGSADWYRVLANVEEIEDCLVTAQPWKDDERVILCVVLRNGKCSISQELVSKMNKLLREKLSPRHVPAVTVAVREIPYTHSGKKVEVAVKRYLSGRTVPNLASIRNPESLDQIKSAVLGA